MKVANKFIFGVPSNGVAVSGFGSFGVEQRPDDIIVSTIIEEENVFGFLPSEFSISANNT